MTSKPEYLHYKLNPCGKGLERVADIYIAKNFDVRGTVTASEELLSLTKSGTMSDDLRIIINQVLTADIKEEKT